VVGNPGNKFGKYLQQRFSHPGVNFTGAIYDKDRIDILRSHAGMYYHGHSVGGTNPSLLEAMATGARISAHDNPFNRAVLQDLATYFSTSDEVSEEQISLPPMYEGLSKSMKERIRNEYSWEKISRLYLDCFERGIARRSG
jgi:glycosyltransferase involved in cell wall biosynthesis